jgi:SAM-dependent methyltransferase
VPISYHGRTYSEGKKIGWVDGVRAIGTILRYGLLPDQASAHAGFDTLSTMDSLGRYNEWLRTKISPALGKSIFEAGCGTGTITRMLARRARVVAVDFDQHYVSALRQRYAARSNVRIEWMDLSSSDWSIVGGEHFDTVVCMNVLEHLPDDYDVLCRFHNILDPGGRLIILVPAHLGLFGPLDTALGHFRRYDEQSLRSMLMRCGFHVESINYINPTGAVGWLVNNRVFRRKTVPPVQASLYDMVFPLMKIADRLRLPFGLSVFAVARKAASVSTITRADASEGNMAVAPTTPGVA